MEKKWRITPVDEKQKKFFAEELKISPVVAGVLVKKKFTLEQAKIFMDAERQPFYDPLLLPNMQAAVARIRAAIYKKELITIFGDYDVDGITSTVVLYKTLRELGAAVEYYLPDRQTEGYGVHKEAVDKFVDKTKLLITVDCGIRSVEEVEYASNHMDVIVTDHHLPGDELPGAVAVIDPKRADCEYPDKNLAGVGVAFKLCQALWENMKNEKYDRYLDIVALGTVADIVPLTGENRRIVRQGLAAIENRGLLELIDLCRLERDNITAGHVGFILGPRLNAAGRLRHAGMGVELLLTEDKNKARELAGMLDEENQLRQNLVEAVFAGAAEMVRKNGYDKSSMIVVAGKGWHQGIIGIAASRLVDEFYRPAVVISLGDDGTGKGSCRSIKNFNICDALSACSDKLLAFGGHAMAAGLSLEGTRIEEFRKCITEYAENMLDKEDLQPVLEISQVLPPESVGKALIQELALLEPFGMGNPAPLFLCGGIKPDSVNCIGRDSNHLKFTFSCCGKKYTAIGWNIGDRAADIENKSVDFIFQPELNSWNDREYIQFKIKDIKLSQAEDSYPSHDMIGAVYLFLKKAIGGNGSGTVGDPREIADAYRRLSGKNVTGLMVEYCLQVMSEIGIVAIDAKKNTVEILPAPKEKKDLNTSPTFLRRYR